MGMNDDLLNNFLNSLMGRETAVVVRLGQGGFQVPYFAAVGIAGIRMELDRWRDDVGDIRLDPVMLRFQHR
ncbi:MAG: hypothetical protein J0I08_06605 [Rhizobiales bacterium]|nr:hypothetical protein [Hyphomicrobiales bacterium]